MKNGGSRSLPLRKLALRNWIACFQDVLSISMTCNHNSHRHLEFDGRVRIVTHQLKIFEPVFENRGWLALKD